MNTIRTNVSKHQSWPVSFTQQYDRNLAALAAFQPPVAALVDAAPVPDGVTPATGRDGTSTFQLPDKRRGLVWLGGSSMPSISAVELLSGVVEGGVRKPRATRYRHRV